METLSLYIPDEKIAHIRDACSIVDIISEYVALTKVGVNYKGLCPFHHEKTPSFFVNEAKKIFHCFGCGASGDVFTFIMKHENLSFQAAVRHLAKRQGIPLPEKELTPQQRRKLNEQEALFSLNELAAKFYHTVLVNTTEGNKARAYLQQRGISAKTLEEYCIGCAPAAWGALAHHLKSNNASLSNAQRIGLIIAKGDGTYYDRFRDRIIFPIFTSGHKIIGFGGRIIEQGEPKYLNSPESVIYNKRQNLYGLPVAAKSILQQKEAILVEGYFDILTLHQHGITNSVASLGTALTEDHIHLLRRYTANIITVFDSDKAGENAMVRSLAPFLEHGVSPRLILLPPGHDPDSFVREREAKAFTALTSNAEFLLDYVLKKTMQKHNLETPQGKLGACEEVAPVLRKISNDIERDLYVQKVAQQIGIKESHFLSMMRKTPGRGQPSSYGRPVLENEKQESMTAEQNAERLILELILSHPETIALVGKHSVLQEFTSPPLKEVGILLCNIYQQHGSISIPDLVTSIHDEGQKKLITELSLKEDCGGNPIKMLSDCIQKIRLHRIKQQMDNIQSLLKAAEKTHDTALCEKFQMDWQKLLEEKKRIQQFTITTSGT